MSKILNSLNIWVLLFLSQMIVIDLVALPIKIHNNCIEPNKQELFAKLVSENRDLVDQAKIFHSLPKEKRQEFQQRDFIYNMEFNNLNLNNELANQFSIENSIIESVNNTQFNETHFISEIFCRYEYETTNRENLFPKVVYKAKLKKKYFFKNQHYMGCLPIQSLMPVLIKTKECVNGFFKFELKFEIITVAYKLVLFNHKEKSNSIQKD